MQDDRETICFAKIQQCFIEQRHERGPDGIAFRTSEVLIERDLFTMTAAQFGTQPFAGFIQSRPVKPTGDGGVRFQFTGSLCERDEDVLGDFLGRPAVADLPQGGGVDEIDMLAHERGEGILAAARAVFRNQPLVLFRHDYTDILPPGGKTGNKSLADFAQKLPYSTPLEMNLALDSIGIIAGNRSLPLEFARLARAAGVKKLVAVAVENETDPALAKLVDEIVWIKIGQLGKMISAFTDRGITQCVMVGQIAPKNLWDLRLDMRAMSLFFKIKEKNAHSLFGAVANELKKDGVDLVDATPWLAPLMPSHGFHLGPKLSAEQKEDVDYGFKIAKEISRLEIGQLVVVKNGTVTGGGRV